MANTNDLEFQENPVEGFFNELEEEIKAKITSDGVYKLTKTKEEPSVFIDAQKVTEVPDGLNVVDGRIEFAQDEVDYLFIKFKVDETAA
jgi:hypothetical protein